MSPSFLIRCSITAAVIVLCAGNTQNAGAQSADEIMSQLRFRQSKQKAVLNGRLRSGPTKVPFRLEIAGPTVRYLFKNPDRTLQVRLGDRSASIEEISEGEARKVSPARWDEKLFGTDVTMEDISLQFIYWPDAEVTDPSDKKLGRPAWKIRLKSPTGQSQYGHVDLWVDKQSGAFMEVAGYDKAGQLIRQFKLNTIQKVNDTWYMKQMRITNPATRTQTYLEVEEA